MKEELSSIQTDIQGHDGDEIAAAAECGAGGCGARA